MEGLLLQLKLLRQWTHILSSSLAQLDDSFRHRDSTQRLCFQWSGDASSWAPSQANTLQQFGKRPLRKLRAVQACSSAEHQASRVATLPAYIKGKREVCYRRLSTQCGIIAADVHEALSLSNGYVGLDTSHTLAGQLSRPPGRRLWKAPIPSIVKVRIEVPFGSFVKRRPDGEVDYIGPVPCPFNYGSVLDTKAPDGDPLDAVVLGPPLAYGSVGSYHVKGVAKIVDAGEVDDKLICTQGPLLGERNQWDSNTAAQTSQQVASGASIGPCSSNCCLQRDGLSAADLFLVTSFFHGYAVFKGALNAARGKHGRTAFDGYEPLKWR